MCYKYVHSFRVNCLFSGQYNTKGYGTIRDVISFTDTWMVLEEYAFHMVNCLGLTLCYLGYTRTGLLVYLGPFSILFFKNKLIFVLSHICDLNRNCAIFFSSILNCYALSAFNTFLGLIQQTSIKLRH